MIPSYIIRVQYILGLLICHQRIISANQYLLNNTLADPDLQVSEGPVYLDPGKRGGPLLKIIFLRPSGLSLA